MPAGAQVICETLRSLGAEVVFGMPGSQNVALFDALRTSGLRTVTTTHEMSAVFAAIGYYRASGRVGVVTTIPGPGFAYATAGLAEASHDSAALVHIMPASNDGTDRPFQFQDFDHLAVARALAKDVMHVVRIEDLAGAIRAAFRAAVTGEPGPVVVVVARDVFRAVSPSSDPRPGSGSEEPRASDADIEVVARALAGARRIALLVGQGAQGHGARVRALAERLESAVLTTSSGRGVIPEDDPRSLYYDLALGGGKVLNAFLDECDLILAIGCKLTHNGSGALTLRIAKEKFIHVDSSRRSLRGNYPATLGIESDAGLFLEAIGERLAPGQQQGWSPSELARWRARVREEQLRHLAIAPVVLTQPVTSCGDVFDALREALPADGIVVTDSGLHQALTRGHFRVMAERGLIVPADFQSMGFGLPASIGAKIAAPARRVVLVIGDGGMALSGLEILTAVRERLDLTVVVFNDQQLSFIRLQQIRSTGRTHMVGVQVPDFALFAASVGARYWRLDADMRGTLAACIATPGVNVVEVLLGDPRGMARARILGTARRLKRGRRLRRS